MLAIMAISMGTTFAMNDFEISLRFNKLYQDVAVLKTYGNYISSNCKVLKKNVCGPCVCINYYGNENKIICDCQHLPTQRDCLDFYQLGYKINGIYQVTMNHYLGRKFQVYCDQTTDGGGWTVFQRRTDGSINFYRNWHEYKVGFGDLRNEFWLGNFQLHKLVNQGHLTGNELRVDLENFVGRRAYAKYEYFNIGDEFTKYVLNLGGYSGNATNSMKNQNGMKFSTYDQDNDPSSLHCAQNDVTAWWYRTCSASNINGFYTTYQQSYIGYGVCWSGFMLDGFSELKWTEMKVRRK